MNQNINLDVWDTLLREALWWESNLHPDYSIILYKYVMKAYDAGLKYYVRDPSSGEVELTRIYEQLKMFYALKADYK